MSYSRPNWAQIDLSALRHNARALAKQAAPARLIAIIKAGAYGHGAVEVANALHGIPEIAMLAVASVDEGIKLRESGISAPILLLSALLPSEAGEVVRHNLTPTVWTLELATALNEVAMGTGKRFPVHFKVDTGMGRLGEKWPQAPEAFFQIFGMESLKIVALYTHFASADDDSDLTTLQLKRFDEFCAWVSPDNSLIRHASNSAAVLRYPKARYDLVRPGLALYGANPCPGKGIDIGLLPVMTWKARVTSLKSMEKGQSVSYGATWVAARPSRIAVLPVGYADGYHRSLSNRGEVFLNGKRVPVVGRVTMDQIMVDVTDVDTHLGDEVTLFGQNLPVEEVASQAGTIPYELMCAVSGRVPRIYSE